MDGTDIFPCGWHPQKPSSLPDGVHLVDAFPSRTAVGGVRYYFIDFGISSLNETMVYGLSGQERAPELSMEIPYDPFKLDVYVLGMAYRRFLLAVSRFSLQRCFDSLTDSTLKSRPELNFLSELVDLMTPEAPEERPTAAEALRQFQTISSTLDEQTLSQRIRPAKPEPSFLVLLNDYTYRIQDYWWRLRFRITGRTPHNLSSAPPA